MEVLSRGERFLRYNAQPNLKQCKAFLIVTGWEKEQVLSVESNFAFRALHIKL